MTYIYRAASRASTILRRLRLFRFSDPVNQPLMIRLDSLWAASPYDEFLLPALSDGKTLQQLKRRSEADAD